MCEVLKNKPFKKKFWKYNQFFLCSANISYVLNTRQHRVRYWPCQELNLVPTQPEKPEWRVGASTRCRDFRKCYCRYGFFTYFRGREIKVN